MYEILCLISSNIQEKEISDLMTKIEEILKNFKIQPVYKNNLGLKKLSYSVRHEKRGYYFIIGFESAPDLLKKIEEKLKNIPEILRYQIIKTKGWQKKEESKEGKPSFTKTTEGKKEKIDLEKLDEKIEKILADENKLIK